MSVMWLFIMQKACMCVCWSYGGVNPPVLYRLIWIFNIIDKTWPPVSKNVDVKDVINSQQTTIMSRIDFWESKQISMCKYEILGALNCLLRLKKTEVNLKIGV